MAKQLVKPNVANTVVKVNENSSAVPLQVSTVAASTKKNGRRQKGGHKHWTPQQREKFKEEKRLERVATLIHHVSFKAPPTNHHQHRYKKYKKADDVKSKHKRKANISKEKEEGMQIDDGVIPSTNMQNNVKKKTE